jgi:parallel beta-helix repeat protein
MASGDTLQLTNSLTDQIGTCIQFGGKDNVIFDCLGNTIDGDDSGADDGIWLNDSSGGSNNNTVRNCVVTGFEEGIFLRSSSNNTFTNINASYNSAGYGFYIESGSSNRLTNINASYNLVGIFIGSGSNSNNLTAINAFSNTQSGILVSFSFNNTLANINANYNTQYGISLASSSNNTLTNINASYNTQSGITLSFSFNNTLANINASYISGPVGYGIFIYTSSNNTIVNLTASYSPRGVYLYNFSRYNTIRNSRIENNAQGIRISYYSSYYPIYNIFYNNYLNNSVNLYSDSGSNLNYWNTTKTSGTNIIGGSYIGGNYWSQNDTDGNFSDSCADANGDGICDSAVNLTNMVGCSGSGCFANATDWLPLTDHIPPQAPSNPSGTPSTTQIILIWNPPADNDVAGYIISRCQGAGCTPVPINTTPTNSYIDTGLTPSTLYNYSIVAYDFVGNVGPPSVFALATTGLYIAKFSADDIHIEIGKNALVKLYVRNSDLQYAQISLWLGGDYYTNLAKFSVEQGMSFTPDQRNVTVRLNPKEERELSLIIISTGPKSDETPYNLIVNSNTTASTAKDSDELMIHVDYAANFPGLESWAIVLIVSISCLLYWRFHK